MYYTDTFWTTVILFTACLHLRIKIFLQCFAIIQKVMFTIRGKLTTSSAVAQIQAICYVTSAISLTTSHPSTKISANTVLPISTKTHPLLRNE